MRRSRSATRGSSSARKRRTPSTDSNAPAPAEPSPRSSRSTRQFPPIRRAAAPASSGSPPTVRCPSTTSVRPASGCVNATTTTSAGTDRRNSRSVCATSSAPAAPWSHRCRAPTPGSDGYPCLPPPGRSRQLAQHERVKPVRLTTRRPEPRPGRRDLIGMQRQQPQPRIQQPLDQQPVRPLDRDQRHLQPHQRAAQRPQPFLIVRERGGQHLLTRLVRTTTSCFSDAQSTPA